MKTKNKLSVAIAAVSLIIVGAYVTRSKTSTLKTNRNVATVITPTAKIVPYITSFQTKDNGTMKEYIDSVYGFHFSYPAQARVGYIQTQNNSVKQWGFSEAVPGINSNTITLTIYNKILENNKEGIWEASLPERMEDYRTLLKVKSNSKSKLATDITQCTEYKSLGTKIINGIIWHRFESEQTTNTCTEGTWYRATSIYISQHNDLLVVATVNPYTESANDILTVWFNQIISSFNN